MLTSITLRRRAAAIAVAGVVGAWGLHAFPLDPHDLFLGFILLRTPRVGVGLFWAYAALWFSTPYLGASLVGSGLAMAASGRRPRVRMHALAAYPQPEQRSTPSLVLGEAHLPTTPGRAPAPTWLTIPQRGLYTGVLVLGAVGTGKTSACMYPYTEQLLRWRAGDPAHRVGGLVLEVKGDFCRQVRQMLIETGRGDDYVEIGLQSGYCYNPIHNDLDPYAVAYAIATLLNNLFGKSKEPFWQQAYTDLLKFVILLRRCLVGYTTLAEVYQYILDESQFSRDMRELATALEEPPEVLIIATEAYRTSCASGHQTWAHWFAETADLMAHPYDAELEAYVAGLGIPFEVRKTRSTGWLTRRHQLQAIQRWHKHGWSRLDNRLRSSITEGVIVFLSLFDDNPIVHETFCPPRSAYINPPQPGHRRPLPPLETLLETGAVLALNFPVAMNPGCGIL